MTSPRRTRINKKRKKKLMKTGGLFLFSAACHCFYYDLDRHSASPGEGFC